MSSIIKKEVKCCDCGDKMIENDCRKQKKDRCDICNSKLKSKAYFNAGKTTCICGNTFGKYKWKSHLKYSYHHYKYLNLPLPEYHHLRNLPSDHLKIVF